MNLQVKKTITCVILATILCISVYMLNSAKIKVSVLIPVYKVEKYLRECMDSVVNQTLKEIEIICVDDGSPDNCGKILDEYAAKDKRIHVIHQENKGLPSARMAGIEMARGEYIKFVDSDDILDLNACKLCYDAAKEIDADLVVHNAYFFNKKEKGDFGSVLKNQYFFWKRFDYFAGHVWRGLYKTSLIKNKNLSFNVDTQMYEDVTFNEIFIPHAQKITTISDKIYYYRIDNNQSLCHVLNTDKKFNDLLSNIKFVYDNWSKYGFFEKKDAKVKFLSWTLSFGYIPCNSECFKKFIDVIDNSLLEDDVINRLPDEKRYKLKRIIKLSNS